jgi:hypothetical protein
MRITLEEVKGTLNAEQVDVRFQDCHLALIKVSMPMSKIPVTFR